MSLQETDPRISRNLQKSAIALSSGLLVLTGCGKMQDESRPIGTTIPAPEYDAATGEEEIDVMGVDIARHYPELLDSKVMEVGRFETESGSQVDWYNFSGAKFNADNAAALVNFMQGKLYQGTSQEDPPSKVVAPLQESSDQQLVLFVVPEGVPGPKWSLYYDADFTKPRKNKTVGFARIAQEQIPVLTPEDLSNVRVANIVCDMLVKPLEEDPEKNPLYCDSLGLAYEAKQWGWDFAKYKEYMDELSSQTGLPVYPVNPDLYSEIPIAGPILEFPGTVA